MVWPAPVPGWMLEVRGDADPRGMTVTEGPASSGQNPAYRPACPFSPVRGEEN